ncbi:3'-5' RNA exonuclease complex component [Dispira simplex]|nr:3'-5' RNA exonuclease complex component [Dispira simplex]
MSFPISSLQRGTVSSRFRHHTLHRTRWPLRFPCSERLGPCRLLSDHARTQPDNHHSLIDLSDLLDFSELPSLSVDRPSTSHDQFVRHAMDSAQTKEKETLYKGQPQSSDTSSLFPTPSTEGDQPAVAPADLERFSHLIEALEEGVRRQGPIDWTLLERVPNKWRRYTSADVIRTLNIADRHQLQETADQMMGSQSQLVSKSDKLMDPSELPLDEISSVPLKGEEETDGPSVLNAPSSSPHEVRSSSPSSDTPPAIFDQVSDPQKPWLPLMLNLLEGSCRGKKRSTHPSSTAAQRRLFSTLYTNQSTSRLYTTTRSTKSQSTGLSGPIGKNSDNPEDSGSWLLYYPPELYQRAQPVLSPIEAIQIRKHKVLPMGTPLPPDHPMIVQTRGRVTVTVTPATVAETSDVPSISPWSGQPESLDDTATTKNDSEEALGTSPVGITTSEWGEELGKESTGPVNIPLQPGDLVELATVNTGTPRFGIILASTLPEAGSNQFQVLTSCQKILGIRATQVTFWIPGFAFSSEEVLEGCWAHYTHDHVMYRVPISEKERRLFQYSDRRTFSQEILRKRLSEDTQKYLRDNLTSDLNRALPQPENILPIIPVLRQVLRRWQSRIEGWQWKHYFQFEVAHQRMLNRVKRQSTQSKSSELPTSNPFNTSQTDVWCNAEWESRELVPISELAKTIFHRNSAREDNTPTKGGVQVRLKKLKSIGSASAATQRTTDQTSMTKDSPVSTVKVDQLYAVHRHMISHPFDYQPDPRGLAVTRQFYLRDPQERERLYTVQSWVRERSPELLSFIDKARQVLEWKSGSTSVTHNSSKGKKGKIKVEESQPANSKSLPKLVASSVDCPVSFDSSDAIILDLLRSYVVDHAPGSLSTVAFYDNLVPGVLKPLKRYPLINKDAVVAFLAEVGVWQSWENWHNLSRTLPLPGTGLFPKLEATHQRLVEDIQQTLKSIHSKKKTITQKKKSAVVREEPKSFSSPHTFYDRDLVESIRVDWNDQPVYTIDDVSAHEIDDGVSIERDPVTGEPTWLHIHIADPTSFVPPDHPLARYLNLRVSTTYFSEEAVAMLPGGIGETFLGLNNPHGIFSGPPPKGDTTQSTLALTFSARIGDQGEILEYTIRPTRLHHLHKLTYKEVDQSLATVGETEFVDLPPLNDPFALGNPVPCWHPGQNTTGLPDLLDHLSIKTPSVDPTGVMHDSAAMRDLRDILVLTRRRYHARVRDGAIHPTLPSAIARVGPSGGVLPESARPGLAPLLDPATKGGFMPSKAGEQHDPWICTIPEMMAESISRMLIAECMILGNHVAARFCQERQIPVVYRNQGKVSLERLEMVQRLASEVKALEAPEVPHSVLMGTGYLRGRTFTEIYGQVTDRALHQGGRLTLRDVDRIMPFFPAATLDTHVFGHAMLGLPRGYTRVTSPLRRYVDMVAHWQIKAYLLYGSVNKLPFTRAQLDQLLPEWLRTERTINLVSRVRQTMWLGRLLERWQAWHNEPHPKPIVLSNPKGQPYHARSPFIPDEHRGLLLQGQVVAHTNNPLYPVLVYLPSVGLTARVHPSDICRANPTPSRQGQVHTPWSIREKPLLAGDRVIVRLLELYPSVGTITAEILEVKQIFDEY